MNTNEMNDALKMFENLSVDQQQQIISLLQSLIAEETEAG